MLLHVYMYMSSFRVIQTKNFTHRCVKFLFRLRVNQGLCMLTSLANLWHLWKVDRPSVRRLPVPQVSQCPMTSDGSNWRLGPSNLILLTYIWNETKPDGLGRLNLITQTSPIIAHWQDQDFFHKLPMKFHTQTLFSQSLWFQVYLFPVRLTDLPRGSNKTELFKHSWWQRLS